MSSGLSRFFHVIIIIGCFIILMIMIMIIIILIVIVIIDIIANARWKSKIYFASTFFVLVNFVFRLFFY